MLLKFVQCEESLIAIMSMRKSKSKSPTPSEGRHHGRYVYVKLTFKESIGRYVGLERPENAHRVWAGTLRVDAVGRFKTLALNVKASYKILLLRLRGKVASDSACSKNIFFRAVFVRCAVACVFIGR